MKRTYRQNKRAEAAAETRMRIVEAVAELHRTVGPRATTVAEIARRAGVDRLTVYNHFPDESSLVQGCQMHWLTQHPLPDPAGLASVSDPDARLRAAVEALWTWYAETRGMTEKILREGPSLPSFTPVLQDMRAGQEAVVNLLMEGRRESPELRATLRVALAFPPWAALVGEGQLSAAQAVDLVSAWARAAEGE
jgi:AcrR family transcriptional regulator